MTVQQILLDLDTVEPIKPMTKQGLYKMFKKFKIVPQTHGIRPVHYPDNTARVLRIKVGLISPRDARNGGVKLAKIPLRKKARR